MPARHLKTMSLLVCLSAWILAHDPCAQIMIVTYGGELRETISRSILKDRAEPLSSRPYLRRASRKGTRRQLILSPRAAVRCTQHPLTAASPVSAAASSSSMMHTTPRMRRIRKNSKTDDRSISLDRCELSLQLEDRSHHGRGAPC